VKRNAELQKRIQRRAAVSGKLPGERCAQAGGRAERCDTDEDEARRTARRADAPNGERKVDRDQTETGDEQAGPDRKEP
jgi:hypothetical protein